MVAELFGVIVNQWVLLHPSQVKGCSQGAVRLSAPTMVSIVVVVPQSQPISRLSLRSGYGRTKSRLLGGGT
jgi:hypothetical protein